MECTMSSTTILHTVAKYVRPELAHAPHAVLDGRRRIPCGWGAFAVLPEEASETARLSWPASGPGDRASRLRVTVASDDRERKQLRVALAGDGRTLGTVDIRYGTVFQPFELALSAEQTAAAIAQGLALSLSEGMSPLWLLYDPEPRSTGHTVLLPHLLIEPDAEAEPEDRLGAFFKRVASLASVQQFGWMEGCVLEGLEAIANSPANPARAQRAAAAVQAHLALFFPGSQMVYEDPRGNVADGAFHTIEATLMAAPLARHRPEHPAIELALQFWNQRRNGRDVIADGQTVSAEGNLTVAYPISVLARLRQDRRLARLAAAQLLGRQRRLRVGDDLYLRHDAADDSRSYRNWARGVAWYLLGLTRTIIELDDWTHAGSMEPFKDECRVVGEWAIRRQREDGLWDCFLHRPETEVETSGSAGIAAALALADRHGFGPEGGEAAAWRAFEQLQIHLTPDGLLGGASQSNKPEGGEALQRSGYRTVSQAGMGLMAQLAVALGR